MNDWASRGRLSLCPPATPFDFQVISVQRQLQKEHMYHMTESERRDFASASQLDDQIDDVEMY